jgi:ABC-type lipoprotein export system ATPase subunit
MTELVLQVKGLSKSFKQGRNKITILDNADFELKTNEVVALVGPSGCGKTTFLQMLGLLDVPDKGSIIIKDINYSKVIFDYKKTICRRYNIGFIYQAYNLLNDFTVLENTMLPLRVQSVSKSQAKKKALALLKELGLEERVSHLPAQLSGGEQQRAAVARSIIHEPSIILADEPTGNLDHDNSIKVINILIELVKKLKKSLFMVTHNMEIVKKADRIMTIDNGKLVKYK